MLQCLLMQIATLGWVLLLNYSAHVFLMLRDSIQADDGS